MALIRTGSGSTNPMDKGYVYAIRRGVQKVAINNGNASFTFESNTQQSGCIAFLNDGYSTMTMTASGSSNYQVAGIKNGAITSIGSYVNSASYSGIDISGYDMIMIDGMVMDSVTSLSFSFT